MSIIGQPSEYMRTILIENIRIKCAQCLTIDYDCPVSHIFFTGDSYCKHRKAEESKEDKRKKQVIKQLTLWN